MENLKAETRAGVLVEALPVSSGIQWKDRSRKVRRKRHDQ